MIVMKFGGTSVAGKEAISRTIDIIGSKVDKQPVVVVSAMSGVTDLLYKIADTAARKDHKSAMALLSELRERHVVTVDELLEGNAGYMLPAISGVNEICDELEQFVIAVCALGELSDRSRAFIVSNGELLSSTIISYALNAKGISTEWLDARKMIITAGDLMKGEPQSERICELVPEVVGAAMKSHKAVITQGFIASDVEGMPSVLGRGGSDYTASLIGMAMNVEAIEIWTDVDGVLTADPRVVKGARKLDTISFEEAAEMAHFGAKVLHPLTIEPAVRENIPIYVLNSMNPAGSGTLIIETATAEDSVKSVSFKENIQVINIFTTKMIDASGFLSKVFDIFSRNNVSVDLISTTEANISVTCDQHPKNIEKVVKELSEFADVEMDGDKSQISVIGKNLVNIEGLMQKMLEALRGKKLYMISQGASYINISVVVDRAVLIESVNSIHHSLFE
ncbi:MAG: aspartate kinase [Bacteroidales bacterium]|nr:aspartate kinase [Bacteroidales bacterium]